MFMKRTIRTFACAAVALACMATGTAGVRAGAAYGHAGNVVEVRSLDVIPDGYEAGGGVEYVFMPDTRWKG